jgi:CheY-like chemotaxis protein
MKENYGLEVEFQSKDRIVLGRKDITVLLFQSIRELLFNVQKHSGVKLATLIMEKENGELHVAVSDQGMGFNPGTERTDSDYDQKFGLFSIQERLMLLDGRFEIESAPNEGTTISLVVPIDEKGSTEKELEDLSRETHVKQLPPEPVRKRLLKDKIQVMIVDDHPAMREGMTKILETFPDIEVVGEASDGEEAVSLARKIVPDVILMDVNMPKMNGMKATRAIHSEFPHIDIFAFSIGKSPSDAKKMIKAGAKAYYNKSDNIEKLISEIRRK